ncbi:MAG TPA: ATP-binding protein [Caulobacteraceae bacterium]|jgi:signal transduction histidine kinase/CheY-like chemotaxis protein|nr:ATP-binding protein [Caulobacteraceae bacterium]
MTSLARKFLISVGVMTVLVTALATIAAYLAFRHELVEHQVAFMSDYVRERTDKEDRRFSGLISLHMAADAAMRRRMNPMSDAQADRLFDRYFPMQADGTRRSAADSFDGMRDDEADITYGLGAYVSDGAHVPMLEKKALVAAYTVVGHFGEAARSDYDNFYFFTPDTRLVMFGPNRADKLTFYRKTAPRTLDVSHEEMTAITLKANNPGRTIRCTELRALLSDPTNSRMAVSCSTPFDIDGRQVGAFGSSIQLHGYLAHAVTQTLPGATNLIVNDRGGLIAYPGFTKPGVASGLVVARFERDMNLKRTVARIRAQKRDTGVIDSPDGRNIIAYGRLAGPNWWFMISYPRARLAAAAAKSASWILIFGALAAIAQSAIVMWLAGRNIAKPLQRLAESAAWRGRKRRRALAEVEDLEARSDEIGALARALRSEREKVEQVMNSLEDRVRHRTHELETANREKSRFLANMSHELRTPLNGVVAVSEVLAREQKTKRTRELAELVVSSGRLLERVLTDILDFSKIEAGQMSLDAVDFDLATLIDHVARLHEAVAAQKGLSFAWRVAPEAEGDYRGDPVRVTQILSNLLSNAVKFTDHGRVELSVDRVDDRLRFRVIDTGVGFDEATGAKLFNRFQQADASVTRRFGGTGLGLSISSSLAELMQGAICAQSAPGKGSTFELRLPLARATTHHAQSDAPAAETLCLEGVRVLVAEDHPTNQRVARLILEAAGVLIEVVENGALAVEAVKSGGFDAVLMDMQMPVMDGLTAIREIRRWEGEHAPNLKNSARLPIIMLTANALDEHVHASREAGADRHVSKPLRPDALLAALSQEIAAAREADGEVRGAA